MTSEFIVHSDLPRFNRITAKIALLYEKAYFNGKWQLVLNWKKMISHYIHFKPRANILFPAQDNWCLRKDFSSQGQSSSCLKVTELLPCSSGILLQELFLFFKIDALILPWNFTLSWKCKFRILLLYVIHTFKKNVAMKVASL